MNISKQEAQESLNAIDDVIAQTRRGIGLGPTGVILIIWGIIWALGYSCSQFFPACARMAWPVLVTTGSISSAIAGSRHRNSMRSANGGRIGIFWLVLFAYAILWMILLHPQLPSGAEWAHYQPMNDRQIGAFFATVPMFAYVVGGLWLGRFFVWLGAIVTGLTVAGFFLLPAWFNLWMAFTGGGSLIVAGVFIRKFWR